MYNIPDPKTFFRQSSKEIKDQIIESICQKLKEPYVQIYGSLILDNFFTSNEVNEVLRQLDNGLDHTGIFWDVIQEFQGKGYWIDSNYHSYDRMNYGPLTLNWRTEW